MRRTTPHQKCSLLHIWYRKNIFFFRRYTKNLSSDKINISTFRGEGELSNLQLDENVLTELLELPAWLRLTSAWCNHVSFRISWTKLKSVPITMVRQWPFFPEGIINRKCIYLVLGRSEHNRGNMWWIWSDNVTIVVGCAIVSSTTRKI